DWPELAGEISLKDALDLAYSEKFAAPNRHPLLGGDCSKIYHYFSGFFALYSQILNFTAALEKDALTRFQVDGKIFAGEAVSIYLCQHHLKLDQMITKEFKFFCDYILFKAFNDTKEAKHPIRSAFDGLNSRYDLHF